MKSCLPGSFHCSGQQFAGELATGAREAVPLGLSALPLLALSQVLATGAEPLFIGKLRNDYLERKCCDMGRTRTELSKGGPLLSEGLNDEELNFFHALMTSPKELSDQLMLISQKLLLKVLYHLIYQPFIGFR
jgi:hypothetical protein